MENYFNTFHVSNSLLIGLQSDSLESILKKAKELEKKYEWLPAVECYQRVSDLAHSEKDIFRVVDLQEKMGFCYFKAAFQCKSNEQFKEQLMQIIISFEKIIGLFSNKHNQKIQIQIDNLKAKIFYLNSWIEFKASKKVSFLEKWWKLKSKVLKAYETIGDQYGIAKTCNDLVENSCNYYYWSRINRNESIELRNELISLGEKAIITLRTGNIEYELARAYCWTSLIYSYNNVLLEGIKPDDLKKAVIYSKRAIQLSERIQDAWLIGWSHYSAALTARWNNDPKSSFLLYKEMIRQGKLSRDNYLLGVAHFGLLGISIIFGKLEEDTDKIRKILKKNLEISKKISREFKIINLRAYNPYFATSFNLNILASIEVNNKNKYDFLLEAVKYGRKAAELSEERFLSVSLPGLNNFTRSLYNLSQIESDQFKKEKLLEEILITNKKTTKILELFLSDFFSAMTYRWEALAKASLSKIETDKKTRIRLLKEAVVSIENCIQVSKKDMGKKVEDLKYSLYADIYYSFGKIFYDYFLENEERNVLLKAIDVYKEANAIFNKLGLLARVAESYWQIAKLQSLIGEHLKANRNYVSAASYYSNASKKIPQLEKFYKDYSLYMQAWSQIEQGRYSHSIENYEAARQNYEKAAKLHESTSSWSYLTPNYFAWANMEEAESLSRKESTELAKRKFQKAHELFCNAKEAFKQKLEEIISSDEKEMTQKLFETTDLRRKYCEARILLEDAKLLDKQGNFLQSSKSYGETAQKIFAIVEKIDVETERKELKYLATLCQAWQKMAMAEETTSSESYLVAAELFEKAKNYCYTRKASLWILGNSSFCRGLAAGVKYQINLNKTEHAKAKSYLKNASTKYLQAGLKNASEYAKASQRLLDAFIFMNQAEVEADQEKRAKQYQMAENLLQIAAGSFVNAKHPEKSAQVQEILVSVREEKTLAVSLSKVMQAPTIASTTSSFTAPTPTGEASVGLESFQHANVQANLVTHVEEVKVGESFCLSIEFVNAGREPALLTRVEEFIPSDFTVIKKPEIYRMEESCLNMKGKQLAALKLVEVKLVLQPSKKGEYRLNPRVHYLDERGQNRFLRLKTLEIKVKEVFLEHRVSTGTRELDSLLLGGIPEGYSVALTGSPSDERAFLIKNFLEEGIKEDQITFYVNAEADGLEHLLEKSNFYLFLCNPKPKTQVPDHPNIYKLRSKTDLTNLSISLAKAFRNIDQTRKRRICVEIISDVLLHYKADSTRNWVSELITDLGSKGFTILAVMNPGMHPPDHVTAVIDLFDGEISITQSGDPLECKKSIWVKKLRNQDYIKNPICLT